MVDDRDVVQAELLDILLHRAAVVSVVLDRDDRSLARDERGLDRDGLARNDADRVVGRHVHLVEDDRADLAADVADGAAREARVVHADLIGRARVRIEHEHGRRGVDAAVDHVLELAVLDRAGRLGAGVVPDIALAQTGAPHAVKDVCMTCLGEHENRVVRLDRRDQVFIFARNIEDLHLFEIDLRIIRIILQPGKNLRIAEHAVCHIGHSFVYHAQAGTSFFQLFIIIAQERTACKDKKRGRSFLCPPIAKVYTAPFRAKARIK